MFYSSEALLHKNDDAITHFWHQEMTSGFLETKHGKLFYAYHLPYRADYAIVISSGRIEAAQKYQELLWELARNNVAVFIVDHQGQGRSYRHLADVHKGYVGHFDDYKSDLHQFITQIVNPQWQGKKILLGHSMGGAIALDYACTHPEQFAGLFLSAPMLQINTGSTAPWLAKLWASSVCTFSKGEGYVPGHGPYAEAPFSKNELTHSEERYRRFRALYQQSPELQLGGVTYKWLDAAFKAIAKLRKSLCPVPLFIAAAQEDSVVDTSPYRDYVHAQHQAVLKIYAGARHELLCEQDTIRKALLRDLLNFCEQL
ncbi:alpha/beta fold hydrolase [Pseudoalteromonas sp. T1lg48]|uniref:alpha/beta fold hydrolase n=1 Tax=Pseudoalteromonas sp. T1lg48 TaxID=2077100 RepID=UPI000CF74714|nr:alpha/beta fold hydrolase [Pseudoalteromonas sp. T1lg48]